MATNTLINPTLSWTDAPPDLQCVPGDLNLLGPLLAQFLSVNQQISESGGSGDSIAQQALQVANIALATANQALAAVPNRRDSGQPIAVPTGDNPFSVSWSPAFPSTNYQLIATWYRPDAAAAQAFTASIVDGSRTVNGCTLRLDNVPANTKLAWCFEMLSQE